MTALRDTRVALLGYPMNGMGDILPDLNALLRRLGVMVVAEDLGALVARIDGGLRSASRPRSWPPSHQRFDGGRRPAARATRVRGADGARDARDAAAEGGYAGFTFHFDSIGGDGRFEQLPLLAASNLMADGYGFAAEGDVNTASLMCAGAGARRARARALL